NTPRMYKVLLHNDNYTTRDFVVLVLVSIFRKPEPEAVRIMLDVHYKGVGVVGVYPRDIAETRVQAVIDLARREQFPLMCTLEGGDLLAALLDEPDSHARYILEQQGITRLDVLNYISHGITNDETESQPVGDKEEGDDAPVAKPLEAYTTELVALAEAGKID